MPRDESPRIVIDVAPGGVAQIEVFGAAGATCRAMSKPFEDLLGPGAEETLKPEFLEPDSEQGRYEGERAVR